MWAYGQYIRYVSQQLSTEDTYILHHSESRWRNPPKGGESLRGRDKPIHGGCFRHLLIYFPGGVYVHIHFRVLQVVTSDQSNPTRPSWGPHLPRICEGDQIEVFHVAWEFWWIFQPVEKRQVELSGLSGSSERQMDDIYFVGQPEAPRPLETRVMKQSMKCIKN